MRPRGAPQGCETHAVKHRWLGPMRQEGAGKVAALNQHKELPLAVLPPFPPPTDGVVVPGGGACKRGRSKHMGPKGGRKVHKMFC